MLRLTIILLNFKGELIHWVDFLPFFTKGDNIGPFCLLPFFHQDIVEMKSSLTGNNLLLRGEFLPFRADPY